MKRAPAPAGGEAELFKAAQKVTGVTPTWGALTGIRPAKLAAGYLEKE